ncbi:Cation efflux family protein [Modicisalibacter ilicicola DSM 19980]|uniref:Cation efflux family protein n=1 Tax=Modicisalibacter ilicicola DSM 19980 TaxID=1121942 RepID=A0A1M5CZH9_9GAMM|nr:Cation efflux family protein [Halomonas ilicicola DSM 19980]
MALNSFDELRTLSFDLSNRRLEVVHDGAVEPIIVKLAALGLEASLQETQAADPERIEVLESSADSASQEPGSLRLLLGINAPMFVVELTAGLIAQSTGLIADSLDMFADATVYGLALYAVGYSAKMQVRAAHLAGVLQLILALGVLVEVGRRFVFGSEPESLMMMAIVFVALIANTGCLLLISKHRGGGAHMQASWIFSANDVVINMGVIAAGALVAWTGSSYPDLLIGTIVGLIVFNGARRILAIKA